MVVASLVVAVSLRRRRRGCFAVLPGTVASRPSLITAAVKLSAPGVVPTVAAATSKQV
jgi:cystathionine beta-lyase family protein involved in aluminum resistance